MRRFRIRLILAILVLVVLTNLSYLFFLLRIAGDNFKVLAWGLLITVLAAGAGIMIALYLASGITRPINELVKITQAISRGNFKGNIKIHTYSEIEKLVLSFKHMAQQLKDFQQNTKKRNQDLEKIAREKAKELSYIYRIALEVSSTLELNEVLDTIVKRTAEVLRLKTCTILLIDEITADRLKVLSGRGINLKRIEKETLSPGEGISGWAWNRKEALLIRDIDQDNRFIARKKERYYTGSLISAPLKVKNKVIGVINGNNKTGSEPFQKSDLLLLKEIASESAIAVENAILYKSLKDIYLNTISALARALEAKDRYTRSHSENVIRYTVAIAEEINLSVPQIEIIRQACQLHDLGKIGIHDYILSKSGRLSPDEWDEIKLHSLRGAQILQPIGFLTEVADLVKQHHERYDGKGYPSKLRGEDIQLGARIMAVADAFDAMISERPYRKALTLSQAISELKANSGTQFDPVIIKAFLRVLERKKDLVKKPA